MEEIIYTVMKRRLSPLHPKLPLPARQICLGFSHIECLYNCTQTDFISPLLRQHLPYLIIETQWSLSTMLEIRQSE